MSSSCSSNLPSSQGILNRNSPVSSIASIIQRQNSYSDFDPIAAEEYQQQQRINEEALLIGNSEAPNPRFKTEICRNFKEKAKCVYGEQCQFAHGRRELRDIIRNTKYKTKLCQKYWITGYCAYGPRCNFLHDERGTQTQQALSSRGHN